MSTFMAKQREGMVIGPKGDLPPRWFLVDAADQVLGRLAVQIATILRGKHRPEYTPHIDTGEFVIVINAEKIRLTGKKRDSKTYNWYSHYPGGLKETTAQSCFGGGPSGSRAAGGRQTHGAAQSPGTAANDQVEDLRWFQPSPPGSAA